MKIGMVKEKRTKNCQTRLFWQSMYREKNSKEKPGASQIVEAPTWLNRR